MSALLGAEHGVLYHGGESVYGATLLARDEARGTARIRIEGVEVGHAFIPAGAVVTVHSKSVVSRRR